ncbi:matrixin family metalloprotease, partial [Alphaproteobacteria bacterium]|nr:matrixin family metalloprotease [Alphaproteobacteria bacterium]
MLHTVKTLSASSGLNASGNGFSETTHISEDDLLAVQPTLSEWTEVASLLPVDNSLFFKWGGEIGEAADLTFSFVGSDFVDYDQNYYDVRGDGSISGELAASVAFGQQNPGAQPIDYSDEEKAVIRDIFDDWSDASGLNFIEVADTFSSYGEIRLSKLDFDIWEAFDPLYQGAAGFAYHPLGGDGYFYEPIGGDIFIDNKHSPGDGYFEHVVSHEIGHALGLAHPFEGYIPFGSQTSSYSAAKTIMTYNDEASLYAVSPMPIDISAMQFLYGGSSTANQGNTVYTLEEELLNSSKSNYALEGNGVYGDGARVSIIDVGGVDIIKVAGEFDQGVSINLQPGSWSNVKDNQEQLFSEAAAGSLTATFSGGPVIASSKNQIDTYGQIYIDSDTVIEDCELTEYSDVIFDNVASNNIICYGGDDLVSLFGGNDVVDGGLGVDQVALYGSAEYYLFNDTGDNNISIILSEAGERDIQNLFGNDFNEIILKNVEQVSFYASDGATSEPTEIGSLANKRDDMAVVYEPVFLDLTVSFNTTANSYTLTVNGDGISNASDYQTIKVHLGTEYGSNLDLSAGNLGYKFNGGEPHKGRIVDTGESSFSLQFELPEGLVLPNYEFVSASISAQTSEVLGGVWQYSPTINFEQPLSLSFNKTGDGTVAEINELDIQLNKSGDYETDVTYSGKVSSTSNLNHVFVSAYADTSEYETPGRGYDLSFILNSGDITDDGTFSVTNRTGDMPDAYDLSVMAWVVSEDGEVRTYSTDSSNGNLVEVDSGVSVRYTAWDLASANNGDADNIFNISGFYALPGDFINIDVNHRDSEIENHLTYKEIQGIDWLSVSPSGEVSGYVPTEFNQTTSNYVTGGNLIVDYSKVSGDHYEWFPVYHPFVAKDDGREMSIGESRFNLHDALDGPVIVNSIGAGEYESFNGELIYGNTIRLADGSSYTIDSFDGFRNGVGIEVHTSKNDDYINLSGYTASDFYATSRDQMIDITTSPGNDIYIAPSFINDDGEFAGVLDNKNYFAWSKYLGLDSSQGLKINLQGEGRVEIIDQANNYHSFAENIHSVQTSEFSNDEVHGDALNNSLSSKGGVDTFFGGGGVDTFTHHDNGNTAWRGEDYAAELDHKIIIKDYEKGEKIRLKNYSVEDFHQEGTVRYSEALQKTIIAKKLENGQFDDLVEIDGFWRIDDSYLDSGGTLTIKAKGLYDIDSPIIEGSDGNDRLEPMGDVGRYDPGVGLFTQDLEIYGYKGKDDIAGGAGDDILDGGEESDLRSNGRDYDADGNLIIDKVIYIDAENGIVADFETGIVSNDGFGSTDTVSNFERVYGSYHDDVVQLSHDIYRGYTPLYGNDTITGPSDAEIINNSYLGYWNLDNASGGNEPSADPSVTEAHIIFDFDAGTVDKFITGGDFDVKPDGQADYQDTFSGAIEGVVGSRGADIIYGHSTDGKSTVMDGDRTWYYGWLDGYHGDDTIIALGSGDDYLRGGGGDDILIVAGGGEYEKILGHGGSTNWPNYIDTDDDTFVIGGSAQHVYLADYELGEDIILLDYDISGVDAFETSYDFSTDYTSVTVKDGGNTLEDRLFIKGNVKVSGVEATTFNNDALDGSSDPSLNNTTVDTKLVLERSTDVPAETILGGEGDDFIIGEGGSEYIRTGGGSDEVYAGAGADVVV